MKSYKEMSQDEFSAACEEISRRIEKLGEKQQRLVVVDGVICPEKYLDAPIKIMWLLKEVNDKDKARTWSFQGTFAEEEFLDKCLPGLPSLRRVAYVSYGILHGGGQKWTEFPHCSKQAVREALLEIAYVNIKKIPGESTAKDWEIEQAYHENRALLKDQFDLYDPDVVIFGGTKKYMNPCDFPGLSRSYEKSDFGNHYYDTDARYYIDAWHPGVRGEGFTDEGYVMDIVDRVRQWRDKK